MYRPSLVHLETVVAIARLGSYASAAAHLNTTQPTISSRVKELEERLGIQVFERMGRRMVLTVTGRSVVSRYAPLLDELENALRSLTDLKEMSGTLRLGCGEIYAATRLAPFIHAAHAAMPGVNWEIDVDLTINLRRKLARASLDLAVMISPQDDRSLTTARLSSLQLGWTAERALARACGLQRDDAKLSAVPLWSLSKPSLQYEVTLSNLTEGSLVHRLNTCNHVKSLIELVAVGAGAAMLPDVLIANDPRSKAFVDVFPRLPKFDVEFHIARRRDTEDTLILNAYDLFVEHAHQE